MKIFFKFYFCFSIYVFALTNVNAQVFDKCDQIDTTYFTNPTDPNCGSFIPIKINGTFANATPDSNLVSCQNNTSPTVWLKIRIDDVAAQLGTTVVAEDNNVDIVWAIYRGDCDSLMVVPTKSKADSIKCSNDDSNTFIHTVGVLEGINDYYIAVTGIGVSNNPKFTINIWTSAICEYCLGEDGCIPKAIFTTTKRTGSRALDDPLFCPEEEVTICINFNYDASETGVEWLHGLIPRFGSAWDMTNFDPTKINVSPGNPEWFEADGTECAPFINEQMPYLCTYFDPITGILKLCHVGCQVCPCTGPLKKGSPLPSGWFWNTNGGAGCDNDCSPSTHYGIGQSVVDINFCMDLKVKSYEELKNQNYTRDLGIDFQTTSDGVSGCWNDPVAECKLDFAQIGPKWEVDLAYQDFIIAENKTLVKEGNVNINVSNSNGLSLFKFAVDFIPNPNVSGMERDTFPFGQGIINDYLVNNSDSTQIVKYIITIFDSFMDICPISKEVIVFIYPDGEIKPVTIIVFNDINKNNKFEPTTENVLPNFRVFVPEINYSFFTDVNGRVNIFTTKDSFLIDVHANWGKWIESSLDSVFLTNDTSNLFFVGFNEKIDSTIQVSNYLSASPRCNTLTYNYLGITNISPRLPITGKIIYTYDTKINLSLTADSTAIIDQLNRKITWDFKNIAPGSGFHCTHEYIAPVITSNNDSLAFSMVVILENGDTIATTYIKDLLRCSYDPNDKSVYPDRAGNENYLLRTEDLQYTIRFQNIGNDTAFNVLIQDVLDSSLDINTLHVLYASHDLNTQAKGDSVYFIFDDIKLPDSLRSPIESNGFVIFNIKPKADLPENTQIYNQASIYFDQNEPIITNKILNTLVEKLPCPIDAIFIENSDIAVNKDLDKYEWYNCANDSLVFTSTIPQFTPTQNGSYYCVITGRFCNAKTKCIVYDLISSTTDYTSTLAKIYPNPGQDRVTIELKDIIKDAQIAAMTDTKGNHWPVESSRISDNMHSLDTANMPQGVYVIYILDGNGTKYMVKWIKI